MNFPDALFADGWAYGGWLLLAPVVLWCLATAPWRRLADAGQLNVWLGTVVTLTLLWSLKAGVKPGLSLHLLGATAFTLMFGRQLAILGLCLVLAAVTLNSTLHAGSVISGDIGWQPFALNALVMAVLPSLWVHAWLRAVERYFPAHFFVYVLVVAFFGAMLTAAAVGLAASLLLLVAGIYPAEMLLTDYLPYTLLLGFSEGWLNGAAVTLMVVYFPRWVGSFDDRRYLSKQ